MSSHDERKPGRKSAASLEVVRQIASEPARPAPPADLTTEQAQTWREIVASMPADWFGRETHALLAQYCRHVSAAEQINRLMTEYHAGEPDLQRYNRLSIMAARESGAIVSLARSMRLTHQAQMHPRTAGRKLQSIPTTKAPWLPPDAS